MDSDNEDDDRDLDWSFAFDKKGNNFTVHKYPRQFIWEIKCLNKHALAHNLTLEIPWSYCLSDYGGLKIYVFLQ